MYRRCVSNELPETLSSTPGDAPAPNVEQADEPRPLVLIAGSNDLACVDDACLPPGFSADTPETSVR